MFYIVGTPIGNTEDISLRAVRILINSDIILAEDTRSFSNLYTKVQKLFNLHPIKEQKIISFYKDNEFEKTPQVLQWLEEGLEISLVSESGMPLVSDPGSVLLQNIQKKSIPFTVIPGPTAFVNAAILSGLPAENLLFIGFLPRKESKKLQYINILISIAEKLKPITVVFYESPHRIKGTLKLISEILPNSKVVVAREMTKVYEEVLKKEDLSSTSFKGELTVVVAF